MMLSTRGAFFMFMGGDYTSTTEISGPVKKIETGPTNVELYSTADGVKDFLRAEKGSVSILDTMLVDLCGLANRVKIKVPMCSGNTIPIAPKVYQNPDWEFPTLDEIQ